MESTSAPEMIPLAQRKSLWRVRRLMPARPVWKGQIRLALVSIPVEVFPATKSGAGISFRQIHEPTGKTISYEKVVPGVGPVKQDEILKGFEYEKGSYVLLEEKEIESVRLESKKTLELTQFVDTTDIPVLYYEKPYFVVPADDLAEEAFIVLREALKATKKAGLGQLAMRGRESVVALRPCGRGIIMETLRYEDEVNKAASYFRDIDDAQPDAELMELAKTLIEKKSGEFDAGAFHDRYVDALRDLIDAKLKSKGKVVTPTAEDSAAPRGNNVIDLMAALKQSVEAKKSAPKVAAKTADKAAAAVKKPATRRKAS